jgi:hypothetical protein
VGSRHQPAPAQIDPRASFLIAYRCSPNLPRCKSPTRSPYRRSPSRFFSAAVRLTVDPPLQSFLTLDKCTTRTTSPGAAHKPHPHPSPISSTPEHRRHSRALSPPPRVVIVPPPPVDPDLHITPSKVHSSLLVIPDRFPLAAGDRHRRNLAGESRRSSPMSQGLDCSTLNLSEGLAARFQPLPSIQIPDL